MSVMKRNPLLSGLFGGGLLFGANQALAEFGLNLREGVTPISREVYDLHVLIVWVCVIIGVVVFGAMFISILNHRKSKGAVAAQFHESTAVEITWTIIPFLILVGMAIPATKTLLAMEDVTDSDLTVKITGYQWKWHYDYVDEGISFFSSLATPREQIDNRAEKTENYLLEVDHPLVLPVDKKIRFQITAKDVIHSWWMPDLGWKKDAIPGFINESWTKIEKPGTYRGQCAELCGKDHGFMPIVVEAKNEADFNKWVAEQKTSKVAEAAAADRVWTKDELMAKGAQVYTGTCAACHQPNGGGLPGVFPPLVAGHEFSAAPVMLQHLREMGFLSDDNKIVMGPLANHLNIVLNGLAGTAMQAFGGQLGDADIAAVVTYERNSLGNSTGDVVQPSDVMAAR